MQRSIYTCRRENSLTDAFNACIALKKIPNADKFIKRLHLFRVEDLNDLLPLVAGRESAGSDSESELTEEEIEEDTIAEQAASYGGKNV